MILSTWNVQNGTTQLRLDALRASYDVDIAVFQETGFSPTGDDIHWVGAPNKSAKGVSLWSRYEFEIIPSRHICSYGIAAHFPHTPLGPINILNIWAMPNPDYDVDVLNSLSAYSHFIKKHPTIVMGDMNISAGLKNKAANFHRVNDHFRQMFDMQSVYHSFYSEAFGQESMATYYHLWKMNSAFHIDYIYAPPALQGYVKAITVPNFNNFKTSDHRPLICELY